MPELGTLLLFAGATLMLLAVPGPAVLFIVSQSVEHGRKAGLVSVAGIHVGSLVHIGAAAVGISSLIVSSATAFAVVKYAGAAYLLYLGARRLLEPARSFEPGDEPVDAPLGKLFKRGIVVNVLNPKTAVFFLAFLPQFVDVSAGAPALQILVLGLVWVVLGLLSDGAYALLAGSLGEWLRTRRRAAEVERYASGTTLLGLGVATAFASVKRSA